MPKVKPEQTFVCDKPNCLLEYTTKFALKRHLLSSHQRKDHICLVCNKAFGLAQYLKEHQTIHSKEPLFKCAEPGCFKSFKQASKLSSHRLRHSKQKIVLRMNARAVQKNCCLSTATEMPLKIHHVVSQADQNEAALFQKPSQPSAEHPEQPSRFHFFADHLTQSIEKSTANVIEPAVTP